MGGRKGNLYVHPFLQKKNLSQNQHYKTFFQPHLAKYPLTYSFLSQLHDRTGLPLLSCKIHSWVPGSDQVSSETQAFGEHSKNFVRKEEES